MTVRSAELFTYARTTGAAAVGPATRYTVPSGHTTLLKWLTVSTFGGGTPAVIVYAGPTATLQPVYVNLAIPAITVVHLQLGLVLEPGSVIQTFDDPVTSGDIIWISAHGAILDGVA